MSTFRALTKAAMVLPALLALAGPAAADPTSGSGAGPWELVKRGEGIVAHRRKLTGWSLHEFRGRGTVFAPMAKVIAVVNDSERRPEWMARCVAARAVARPSELTEIAYSRTRGGLGISDRDTVVSAIANFDTRKKEVLVTFHSTTHPAAPPVPGVVRMPWLKGHWRFWPSPAHPGATEVEYQVHADPGGFLPTFAVNIVSKEIPHKTIVALRQQVARRSYTDTERRLNALPEFRQIIGTPAIQQPDVPPQR